MFHLGNQTIESNLILSSDALVLKEVLRLKLKSSLRAEIWDNISTYWEKSELQKEEKQGTLNIRICTVHVHFSITSVVKPYIS